MDLSFLIDVGIDLQTTSIQQAAFNIPAMIGESGRIPYQDVVTLTMSADLITGNSFSCKVNGITVGPVAFATDNDTTMAAIAAALEATDDILTAVVSGTPPNKHVITCTGYWYTPVSITEALVTGGATQATCAVLKTAETDRIRYYTSLAAVVADGFVAGDPEYTAALQFFGQSPAPSQIAIINKRPSAETWVEALADTITRSNGNLWYGLVAETRTKADVKLIAAWANTNHKLFGSFTSDSAVLGTGSTDLAAELQALGNDHAFAGYQGLADGLTHDEYPEAAWLGAMLPNTVGSVQWAYKTLEGVTADDLTTTQLTNAFAKNAAVYVPVGGTYITLEGKVASGEWIDVIMGADWLEARLREEIFLVLLNAKKVPFTDKGLAIIECAIRKVLDLSVKNSILESYTVTSLKSADYTSNQKAQRNANGFSFTGILAGAIVYAGVTGEIHY